ncbi:MAG: lipopolysaccharide assembly protein LapA domain-containing protein [Bauldia sp.]
MPIAVVVVVLSVANREAVTFSLDPIGGASAGWAASAPLYVFLFVAVLVGIVIGGVATWVGQGRWRHAARAERANADRLRADVGAPQGADRGDDALALRPALRPQRRLSPMRVVGADEIERLLDYRRLIEAIRAGFSGAVFAPPRQHHRIQRPGAAEATLILMPAWQEFSSQQAGGGFMGVKMVTVFPDNALRQKPSVLATYVLMAGDSGEALATLDGQALTLWRTAATSALAANALARPDASRLAMIGAGAMAPRLIAAHASCGPSAASPSGTAPPRGRRRWPPHSTGQG